MSTTYLNQIELAARWRISPRTLERWRWCGDGPRFVKIGGRVIYPLADVEAYEAAQTRTCTGPAETATPETDSVPKRGRKHKPLAKAVAWALGDDRRPNGRSARS